MSTALSLLKVENEDNALLCIKIIIDGFRSHKVSTVSWVVDCREADSPDTYRSKPSHTFSRS